MADQVPPNPMYEAAFRRQRRWERFKSWLRRGGCLLIFLLWLVVMVFPCALVTLLVNREITINRSDLPDHQIRLFLLQDPDQRGFGLQRGSITSGSEEEGQYCIVTSVDYLLWEGEAENLSYCNCYQKTERAWSSTLVGGDQQCQPVIATPAVE